MDKVKEVLGALFGFVFMGVGCLAQLGLFILGLLVITSIIRSCIG